MMSTQLPEITKCPKCSSMLDRNYCSNCKSFFALSGHKVNWRKMFEKNNELIHVKKEENL